MMQMLNMITGLLNYLLYGMIGLMLATAAGILIVYRKRGQRRRIQEDETDYSTLRRMDSVSFLKIDDICNDMIVMENNHRFVGAIACQGFDFYSAQADEQAATGRNFLSFIDTLNAPVTYREYSKAVDLEQTMKLYSKAYENVQRELYNAIEDQKALTASMKKRQDMSLTEVERYDAELQKLQKRIDALKFRELHVRDQVKYAEMYSGNKMVPDIEQTWLFEWKYNPMDYPVDLTEEQVKVKAVQELASKERSMSHALSGAHVKAKRCRTERLIDMCRRYSAPISATRFKMKDLQESSYFDDINTSDDLDALRDEAEEIGWEHLNDGMTELMTAAIDRSE